MSARDNLIGQRFGRLTVLSFTSSDKHGHSLWLCKCDCGENCVVSGTNCRYATRKEQANNKRNNKKDGGKN